MKTTNQDLKSADRKKLIHPDQSGADYDQDKKLLEDLEKHFKKTKK